MANKEFEDLFDQLFDIIENDVGFENLEEPPSSDTMRSLQAADDCDDIFGPPRTYPTGYCPPARNRLSMISTKYKQKEERRKVLKISMNKLKKIEDPESSLCRSVLINNTVKRLQQETRDEKLQTQQLNYPRCCDNEGYLAVRDYPKSESKEEAQPSERIVEMVIENDFDTKLAEEISTVSAKDMDVLGNLEDIVNPQTTKENQPEPTEKPSRKRSFDEIDDCDVQDVLSQFYMPPTPRMLTAIDDDEDINVVDEEPLSKRLKESEDKSKPAEKPLTDFSINNFINNNNNLPKYASDGELSRFAADSDGDGAYSRFGHGQSDCEFARFGTHSDSDSAFSCGHASMFGDIQSNAYHLIASLET